MQHPCNINITSFDLSKTVTFSKLFSKVKLSPTARLVLRALIDFWNPNKGLMFPGQKMIAESTGATERSVIKAIEELRQKGLILTVRTRFGLTYYFTKTFFDFLDIKEGQTQKYKAKKNYSLHSKKFTSKPEKNSHACHEQKRKQNNYPSKILNFQNLKKPGYFSPEKTKTKLEKKQTIQKSSPLDYSKSQAYEWCLSLPVFLRKKSQIYKQLVKKWNFTI